MKQQIETGCLVDGNVHGIYTYQRLCEIALQLGWQGLMPTDDDIDIATELADEALTYLNIHHADPKHGYGWVDGSIYYLSYEEWETVLP